MYALSPQSDPRLHSGIGIGFVKLSCLSSSRCF
jgi:hypothetical protein